MASVRPRHSGLQKRVLALYRECIRAARGQATEESRVAATQHVRNAFRPPGLRRSDFSRIEYLVKRGERQLAKASRGSGFSVATVKRD